MAEFEAQFSALQSWVNRIGINGEDQNQNSSLCLIIKSPDQKVSSIIVYDLLSFCKKYAKHLALKVFLHRHDFKREKSYGHDVCGLRLPKLTLGITGNAILRILSAAEFASWAHGTPTQLFNRPRPCWAIVSRVNL